MPKKGGPSLGGAARAAGAPRDACSILFPCPKSLAAAKLILHHGDTAIVCFWQGALARPQRRCTAVLGVYEDLRCAGIQGPRPAAGPVCKVLGRDTHADPAPGAGGCKKQVNRHI